MVLAEPTAPALAHRWSRIHICPVEHAAASRSYSAVNGTSDDTQIDTLNESQKAVSVTCIICCQRRHTKRRFYFLPLKCVLQEWLCMNGIARVTNHPLDFVFILRIWLTS